MAIKFNDYFEFPREFDMAPYTAAALSEVDRVTCDPSQVAVEDTAVDNEGVVNCGKITDSKEEKINETKEEKEKETGDEKEKDKEKEASRPGDEPGQGVSTRYRLRGVVVHSGQASGGHYYSFIYLR